MKDFNKIKLKLDRIRTFGKDFLKKITLGTQKSCIIATHNNFLAEKMDRIFLIENQNIKILK